MAKYFREVTHYAGVFWLTINGVQTLYIRYKRPGSNKSVEEKLGTRAQGWTAAKGNGERTKRINGEAESNTEKRYSREVAKRNEETKPTIDCLWNSYLESKGKSLKGISTDKNRYELHLKTKFGIKIPAEIVPLDIDRLRRHIMKDHSVGTVRNVLELLRRIINFGIKAHLCPPLNWTIQLPKSDPDSERIEVLDDDLFQALHDVWDTYHDRHIVNIHKFISWTGSRPSEPLKLTWVDVDFKRGIFVKRDTKGGRSLTMPMSERVRSILLQQRSLLDQSVESMRLSMFVFPGPSGGQRKLDSYLRHFRRIRDLAGIPTEFRPNYCLRDTLASRLLSSGATLDEVAYQLGHSPGSPATRRYARYLASAQQSIVDRAQGVMDEMLLTKRTV